MHLTQIIINSIIKYIENKEINYKNIKSLDDFNYQIIFNKMYELDFEKWKKKIYYSLVEIESKNWLEVEIMYPFFNNNTFQAHYTDIIIKTESETKNIYQFHNPQWKAYFDKAIMFPF